MTDSDVTVEDTKDGYYAEFDNQDLGLLVCNDGLNVDMHPIDDLNTEIGLDNDFKIIRELYPNQSRNYFYSRIIIDSAVSAQLRRIFNLASTCLANSNVSAILTHIRTRAFSSAFSSAFK